MNEKRQPLEIAGADIRPSISERHRIIIDTDDESYLPPTSKEVGEIKDIVQKIRNDIVTAMPRTEPELLKRVDIESQRAESEKKMKDKFDKLATQWKADTQFTSTLLEMATRPAYQHIIGMGPSAIPFILKRLSEEPDHWFWALKAITEEDPVPEESRGNLEEMTERWLKWGREKGYEC